MSVGGGGVETAADGIGRDACWACLRGVVVLLREGHVRVVPREDGPDGRCCCCLAAVLVY